MRKTGVHIIIIRKSNILIFLIALVLILLAAVFLIGQNNSRNVFKSNPAEYDTVMKRDLLCLMTSYGQFINGVEKSSNGNVYIVMQSGRKILYDDKKSKTGDEKLKNSDLQDMLEQIYPLYGANSLSPIDFDPGRNRVYPLFHEIYGQNKEKIEANLIGVRFGSSSLRFNSKNNAADAFKKVNDELIVLTKNYSGLVPFVYPSGGTYNYRNIAGTRLLSTHSFGTAIDLAPNKKDYWQWASREEGMKRMKVYPPAVVRVFENNNFIWGGKWGHFDLMHYEYRPELIMKAKYFSNMPEPGQPWYTGSPYQQDIQIRAYVKVIDNAFK